ncbi:MAG: hypothetical protein QCH96_06860 [Candidatus Thermoplasmatota archaeon]|nr:hypothetical protein [Candidatus Thermoplasmatota archaeon]
MVYEDIEELKKFGKGIQHSSKSFSSKHHSSQRPIIRLRYLKKIRASLSNTLLLLAKLFLFAMSQCKDIVLLKIHSFNQEGCPKETSLTENKVTRKISRLHEQRRQIGDTTIIIRKRIFYDLPPIHDIPNDSVLDTTLIYFFRKQNDTQGSVVTRDNNYRSIFDMPKYNTTKACSIKERLFLFFLRW